MDKIRIGESNIKKIEVNDKGEYIEINLNDRAFVKKFYDMLQDFSVKEKELYSKAEEIEKLSEEKTESYPMGEKSHKLVELDLEVHRYLMPKIDNLFGENACKKIFGDIVPQIQCYAEFFDAILPFFKNFAVAKIDKYNADRSGNV